MGSLGIHCGSHEEKQMLDGATPCDSGFDIATPCTPRLHLSLGDLLQHTLDEIDYGVLLVAVDGQVLLANRAARKSCEAQGALRIEGHRLAGGSAASRATLMRLLDDAARGKRSLVRLDDDGDAFTVAAVPLTRASATDVRGPAVDAVLLMLGKASLCGTLSMDMYAQAHGLTTAETGVLRGLCRGETPSAIARRSGVAMSTVRTHSNSIRAKTGAATLRDLLRSVAMLPPVVPRVAAEHLH
jgi:DNA-binding CsgD family transcriptional regulator